MKLEHWYKKEEDNFGVITHIENFADEGEEDDIWITATNVGSISIAGCNFIPKIGMEVELFTDVDDGGWYFRAKNENQMV